MDVPNVIMDKVDITGTIFFRTDDSQYRVRGNILDFFLLLQKDDRSRLLSPTSRIGVEFGRYRSQWISVMPGINKNSGDPRLENIGNELMHQLALFSWDVLSPMALLFGGTVEQGLYRKMEIANLTLLGILCCSKGKLHIWDRHDSEPSNISRQFLLKTLRNNVNIAAEYTFHNALSETLDVVIIILDNVIKNIIQPVADFDVWVLFPPFANSLPRFDIIESSLTAALRNGYFFSRGLPPVDNTGHHEQFVVVCHNPGDTLLDKYFYCSEQHIHSKPMKFRGRIKGTTFCFIKITIILRDCRFVQAMLFLKVGWSSALFALQEITCHMDSESTLSKFIQLELCVIIFLVPVVASQQLFQRSVIIGFSIHEMQYSIRGFFVIVICSRCLGPSITSDKSHNSTIRLDGSPMDSALSWKYHIIFMETSNFLPPLHSMAASIMLLSSSWLRVCMSDHVPLWTMSSCFLCFGPGIFSGVLPNAYPTLGGQELLSILVLLVLVSLLFSIAQAHSLPV